MDLSGKILFGLTMPRIAPVAGATVKIFKSAGSGPGIPVSPHSAVTDATGFFTLAQCDVAMRVGKDLKVHGAKVTIPSGWIDVPGSSFNLPAFPPVPNFDVGPVQVVDRKLTTDAINVPATPLDITPPDFNHRFEIEVPTHLTIEVTASGEVFRQVYPLPPPPAPGVPAAAPLIVLNRSQPLNVNDIGGKNLLLDGIHRAAIREQQNFYAWQSAPDLPGQLATLPACELPPARYGWRLGEDTISEANTRLAESQPPQDPLTLPDYDLLAPLIALRGVVPKGSDAIQDDSAFAAQRLAGVNPMVIARLRNAGELPGMFTQANQTQSGSFPQSFSARFHLSLTEAANQQKLYLCDYSMLAGLNPDGPRFFHAPMALFFQALANEPLVPAGIFPGGMIPGSAHPIVTPSSPGWKIAKLVVQCADLNLHEFKYHLHDTHFVMEAAAVALHRTMFIGHPVSELLRQHFHVMLLQGSNARNLLLAPGYTVDTALGTGLAGAMKIVKKARAAWTFQGAGLIKDLEKRNMMAAPVKYPYREDALDIFSAISDFVKSYVNAFYADDGQVMHDPEIRDWVAEMSHPGKGNLGAMPSVQTRDGLSQLLSQIIFTCSAQHSAVNYPQYDYFGRVANMPGAIWKDPLPACASTGPAPDVANFLPNKAKAISQVGLSFALSDYRYDQLGEYRDHRLGELPYAWLNPQGKSAAAGFRKKLSLLQTSMTIRNNNRPPNLRYPYLLPKNIINSISI